MTATGADPDVLEEEELEGVGAVATCQIVIALAAADLVRSRAAVDEVLAGPAVDAVVAPAAVDEVGPAVAEQAVRLPVAGEGVAGIGTLDVLDLYQRVGVVPCLAVPFAKSRNTPLVLRLR